MARILALILILSLLPAAALAQACPEPLASARRLLLVTADGMATPAATARLFARAEAAAPWRMVGGPAHALIGKNGLGWAHDFRRFAQRGEPVKVEGDRRAPIGFFAIGRAFGFAPSSGRGYLRIEQGMTCVDDVRSPAYNTITNRAQVGWDVSGENMWRIPLYRRGLLIDYPTNRAAHAGSCIFIHLWLPGKTSTSGCVALQEPALAAVQEFAQEGAVLAVLPGQALDRFTGCLPPAGRP
jgi:D-alanyl-D-alanine dipeptidase